MGLETILEEINKQKEEYNFQEINNELMQMKLQNSSQKSTQVIEDSLPDSEQNTLTYKQIICDKDVHHSIKFNDISNFSKDTNNNLANKVIFNFQLDENQIDELKTLNSLSEEYSLSNQLNDQFNMTQNLINTKNSTEQNNNSQRNTLNNNQSNSFKKAKACCVQDVYDFTSLDKQEVVLKDKNGNTSESLLYSSCNLEEGDSFKQLYKLGKGGQGEVQKVYELKSNQRFALKHINDPFQYNLEKNFYLNLYIKHGFYHSDIKPDNIVFIRNKKGHIKLKMIDFGIASNDYQDIYGFSYPYFHSKKRKYMNQNHEDASLNNKIPLISSKEERISIELYSVGRTLLYLLLSHIYKQENVWRKVFLDIKINHIEILKQHLRDSSIQEIIRICLEEEENGIFKVQQIISDYIQKVKLQSITKQYLEQNVICGEASIQIVKKLSFEQIVENNELDEECLQIIALILIGSDELDKGLELLEATLLKYKQQQVKSPKLLKEQSFDQVDVMLNIADIYSSKNKQQEAILIVQDAVKILENLEQQDLNKLANTYYTLGKLFQGGEDIDKALINFQKAIDMKQDIGKDKNIECQRGLISYKQHEYDEAKKYYDNARNIINKKLFDGKYAKLLIKMAKLFRKLKKFDEAMEFANESLQISYKKYPNDNTNIGLIYLEIGKILCQKYQEEDPSKIYEGIIFLEQGYQILENKVGCKSPWLRLKQLQIGEWNYKNSDNQEALKFLELGKDNYNLSKDLDSKDENRLQRINNLIKQIDQAQQPLNN
ncbi:Protein kinase-like domain [Pseudocohnilembus persalinus]|uniref:Protein kinase-like domain n=1 Tax=Pseudocohnilembus persalinus TaxID=266149 RepID=A0A0V0QQ05_PSEPJ|nr:Protein kinase-like domain [Pseudocohnilembus persalinus]|eukprot:KRX04285.1 Protein kinase-like domain [Pseudocohnilembus persalinus]